ncbi:MAG TPA: hypothetical protein VN832_06615, partial [Stellaceae bacterium]|nr:hypothetical protein [Stellaceae bacterium]
MLRPSKIVSLIQRLIRHRDGTMGLVLSLTLALLVVAGGAAIDFTRAAQIKSMLQGIVDAAATSGASVYTSASSASTAQTIATNFMNNGVASLPPNGGVTFTVTTGTTTSSGSTTGYTVSISASAQPPTTLLGLFEHSLPTSLSATATNPLVNGTFDAGSFVSYACDANSLYWYIVPAGGGVPAASAVNLLWSNTTASPTTKITFPVPASQNVGFAFKNVTGARPTSLGGCNYGNNAYGAHPGDTQWFYSSLQPPSASYSTAPGGASTGTHGVYETTQDCSLVVELGTTSHGSTTFPSAPQGQCYSASGSGETTYPSSGSGGDGGGWGGGGWGGGGGGGSSGT